jgi:hypothetical protein
VSDLTGFKTPDEEVEQLLEECQKLRATLGEISNQVSRMEKRVKRAFPESAKRVNERLRVQSARRSDTSASSLNHDQALAEFDKAVQLAGKDPAGAEKFLLEKRLADLVVIAREVGVSFGQSKPSFKVIKDALYGRIRESLLLSRHNTQRTQSS